MSKKSKKNPIIYSFVAEGRYVVLATVDKGVPELSGSGPADTIALAPGVRAVTLYSWAEDDDPHPGYRSYYCAPEVDGTHPDLTHDQVVRYLLKGKLPA